MLDPFEVHCFVYTKDPKRAIISFQAQTYQLTSLVLSVKLVLLFPFPFEQDYESNEIVLEPMRRKDVTHWAMHELP